jgi:putative Holliday junction resolvase
MPRILGIDYGEKRIGLALSDESLQFSFEYETWSPEKFENEIENLIAEKEIEKIILGHPLNMSGAETPKTKEVLKFKEDLESKVNVPIELVDERLSSKFAAGIIGKDKDIDSLAAQIILETYLNKQN